MPKIETEDQRQNLLAQARRGDRLAYQQLQRYQQLVDASLDKIFTGGEVNQNDIEQAWNMTNEEWRKKSGMNEIDLQTRREALARGIAFDEAMVNFVAQRQDLVDRMIMVKRWTDMIPDPLDRSTAVAFFLHNLGMTQPDPAQRIMMAILEGIGEHFNIPGASSRTMRNVLGGLDNPSGASPYAPFTGREIGE
jgi:hypothetical protein